ncbi:MAG: SDR family oxidoreductase [Ignavibacteriae bacterium]|nr:SDR family oxidoreductase [Ignavibacteriota bacterium]
MMKHPARKVAIVTGGGKRLGKHIAIALAEHGFDVAIGYNSSRTGANRTIQSIQKLGREAIALKADVRDKKQVKKLVDSTMKKFKRIDVLVNNAAIFVESTLENISEEMWDSTLDTNLKGTFLCSQAVAPFMLNQKEGRIINIASLGGLQAWSKHLPYSVSKAGVIMLTRCLAKSLAPNIYVNAIAPGTIEMDEVASTTSQVSVQAIPLRRYGNSTDITSMVVYLATTAEYITGQTFTIDGGRSA